MSTGPVDWRLAERVAVRVSGQDPFARSYLSHSLQDDFAEATARAEELVAEATGLRSLSGPARARVTDRAGWVTANVASFQRILQPITDKLGDKMASSRASGITRKVGGAEVGMLLGWMSSRVLGQYDMLVVDDPAASDVHDQDVVYYVGPNVLALEKRFAFPPKEFRLWLALHEVTHRAQFTGVPWLRGHYLGLVQQTLDSVEPDPKRFLDALAKVVDDLRSGRKPLEDGGIVTLLATPEQRVVLDKVGGLMSLLEGHGDVTMDRAGAQLIPSAHRFARVLRERRANGSPATKLIQRLIGLEAKINQYAQGERFIEEVERLGGGPEALEPVWRGASWLPTLAEIRAPEEWLDRVRLSEELVG
ncbi:MAG TPA: zinc-dependent metalloprotease [Acidimicrobiales bacterium]|nr:zinc-dependent metalloprotease [Acidimicrobiales bacterium]